ncbi:MAG: DNA polymerase III subunit beta [Methylacidiphilales bacterium]|nr:DNA polymerase III subunit beta [Candidatus Methylacidiphilales bacterium]
MKLTLAKQDLFRCLNSVISAAERKHHIQILTHVCVEVKDGTISFTTSDMEIECHAYMQCAAEGKYKVCVNAKKFFDISKTTASTELTLDFSDPNQLLVKSGKSKFVLPCLNGDDFPRFSLAHEKEKRLNFKFSVLLDAIKRVAFCASNSDVRQYLLGIKLEIRNNLLTAIATDGYRLALIDIAEDSFKSTDEVDVIIPKKVCNEILKLGNSFEDINFTLVVNSSSYIGFQFPGLTITSRLIEGRYPDCRALVPENHPIKIIVNKNDLRAKLNEVSIMLNERFRVIIIELRNNLLQLSTNNTELDSAEVGMDISYSGDTIKIGCNVNHLLDVLNSIDADDVSLAFKDPDDKIVLNFTNRPSPQYIVMPSRIS